MTKWFACLLQDDPNKSHFVIPVKTGIHCRIQLVSIVFMTRWLVVGIMDPGLRRHDDVFGLFIAPLLRKLG